MNLAYSSLPFKMLALIQATLGLVWINSGFHKVISQTFPASLSQTLTYFASKNPYNWYTYILNTQAIPNAELAGHFIQWFELIAGFVLCLTAYYLYKMKIVSSPIHYTILGSLVITAVLNLNFYLASGWTSPASSSLNLLMFGIESILLYFYLIYRMPHYD